MDEQQVDIVGLEFLQRSFDRLCRRLLARVGYPYLGGDKELVAAYSALFNGVAYAAFVSIRLSGVDRTISDGYCVGDASFALGRVDLIYAVAQDRHFYSVV